MPKVSIILPIFNVEKYIRKALDSLINQTLEDIEIICVNDCSPDNSMDIVKEYAEKDSRIKIINQEKNSGQGIARNVGIDTAKGEYIMFLDPDDWYELNACELVYNQAVENNNDVVFFEINQASDKKNKIFNRLNYLKNYEGNKNIHLFDLAYPFLISTESFYIAAKRALLNMHDIRFSPERFDEDNIYCIKLVINSKSASVINLPLYNYRVSETSLTSRVAAENWKNLMKCKREGYYAILKSEYKEKFLKMYIPYCINVVFGWYNRFAKKNKKNEKDFYYQMQEFFREIVKDQDIEQYSEYLDLGIFYTVIYKNYYFYKLKRFLRRIYTIDYQRGRRIIYFLGIKISTWSKRRTKDMK